MNPFANSRRRSARETFAKCPFRYKAVYVDGLTEDNGATRRGSVFHDARHRYIAALWKARETDDADLAAQSLHDALVADPLPQAEWSDVVELWTRWTESFSLNLAQYYSVESAQPCLSTEVRFDLVLVPDADTLRIEDAKTNWYVPPAGDLPKLFQTEFYLAAARLLFPNFRRYELVYDWVRWGFTSDPVTIEDIQPVMERIAQIDEAIDIAEMTNAWPARGGSHCSTCPVQCPLADHAARQDVRVVSSEHAGALVERIAALDTARAHAVEALRAWCDTAGAVQHGNVEWAHRPKVQTTYPARGVLDVLIALNVEPETLPKGMLDLPASKIEPLIERQKWAHIGRHIEPLAQKRQSGTEFKGKTMHAEE